MSATRRRVIATAVCPTSYSFFNRTPNPLQNPIGSSRTMQCRAGRDPTEPRRGAAGRPAYHLLTISSNIKI